MPAVLNIAISFNLSNSNNVGQGIHFKKSSGSRFWIPETTMTEPPTCYPWTAKSLVGEHGWERGFSAFKRFCHYLARLMNFFFLFQLFFKPSKMPCAHVTYILAIELEPREQGCWLPGAAISIFHYLLLRRFRPPTHTVSLINTCMLPNQHSAYPLRRDGCSRLRVFVWRFRVRYQDREGYLSSLTGYRGRERRISTCLNWFTTLGHSSRAAGSWCVGPWRYAGHLNAIKGMALTCKTPLQEFLEKIERYKSL